MNLSVPGRRKVVLLLLRLEEPATMLARRYGIPENTLYRWRDDFMAAGEAVLANGKDKDDPHAAVDPTDTCWPRPISRCSASSRHWGYRTDYFSRQ